MLNANDKAAERFRVVLEYGTGGQRMTPARRVLWLLLNFATFGYLEGPVVRVVVYDQLLGGTVSTNDWGHDEYSAREDADALQEDLKRLTVEEFVRKHELSIEE